MQEPQCSIACFKVHLKQNFLACKEKITYNNDTSVCKNMTTSFQSFDLPLKSHTNDWQPQHSRQYDMILRYNELLPLYHFQYHSQCVVGLELFHILTDSSDNSGQ